MATLRRFGEEAADAGDMKVVQECVAVVDGVLADCSGSTRNAVHVSFVESIDQDGPFYGLLTPRLKKAWQEFDSLFQEVTKHRS